VAPDQPWSLKVKPEDIPETGRHVEIVASETERAAIARAAGVDGIERLAASFDLARRGEGLHAVGKVAAQVRQTCVVTLEPVHNEVEESIDLVFAPPRTPLAEEPAGRKRSADDPPEPLVAGAADLGAAATEFLVLAIDPYPRKPGVVFAAPPSADAAAHPFAALAALKKKPGEVKG
jgi:uncharacterized metal-binding protein YceD (DUF177 family)